jgi:hypothetical protein
MNTNHGTRHDDFSCESITYPTIRRRIDEQSKYFSVNRFKYFNVGSLYVLSTVEDVWMIQILQWLRENALCGFDTGGHSAKVSFFSGILYTKCFDCGVSLQKNATCDKRRHTLDRFVTYTSLRSTLATVGVVWAKGLA